MSTAAPPGVVVTGAARGIGRAIAERLAADGHCVVAVDVDADALTDLADGPAGTGGGIAMVAGDVRDPDTLRAAADAAQARGGLGGWVNNAGIVRLAPLHEATIEDIDAVLGINLRAVVLGCRAALSIFLADGVPGTIVNISSVHGRFGFPGYGAYDAAKGGVDALTRHICVEYGHLGIRCNAVAPGVVNTAIVPSSGQTTDRELAAARALSPMARISEPAEIADVVAFLLSRAAIAMNGQVVGVDNGMSARVVQFPPDPDVRFR